MAAGRRSTSSSPTRWPRMASPSSGSTHAPTSRRSAIRARSHTIGVMLSGDGGWAAIDKQLADTLAAHGITVVGLDSRSYFSTQRDPDGASKDLAWIARRYLSQYGADSLILVGYSHGADVLPFMTSRLPRDLLGRVRVVA